MSISHLVFLIIFFLMNVLNNESELPNGELLALYIIYIRFWAWSLFLVGFFVLDAIVTIPHQLPGFS